MKKTNLLFLFVMLFVSTVVVSSCGDDDDEDTVVGTWVMISETTTGCANADDNYTEEANANDLFCYDGEDDCEKTELTFKEDGTLEFTSKYYLVSNLDTPYETVTDVLDYTFEGNLLTICEAGSTDCDALTVSFDGDLVTVVDVTADADGCLTTGVLRRQ